MRSIIDGQGAKRRWFDSAEAKAASAFRGLAFRPYAAAIALTLLCCVLFLPGIASLPVTDRDEARFAQASKQMLETGDFVDIRLQDKPRYNKPAGIYWLQSAAVSAAKSAGAALNDIWPYRIPSFLGALAAVLLTFWSARAVLGRETALAAGALFASCLMLAFEARIAKSDAALIACIALSQGALFRLYVAPEGSRTRGLAALFWLGLGAGVLIKGPVAPALALTTSAAVLFAERRRGWLKNLHWTWGVPLLLAAILPWLIAIGVATDGAFFKQSLGTDFAGKLQGGQESHGAPLGYYTILFWWTFWPATLFATASSVRALWRWRRSRRVIFLAAWIVPFWIAIEAIPTKLPHYALPLYPALAMTAAFALKWGGAPRSRVSAIVWACAALLPAALLIAMTWIAEAPLAPVLAILVLYAAAASIAVAAAWRSCWTVALMGALASAALFYASGFRVAFPALEPIWVSEKVYEAARALEGCGSEPIGLTGLADASLVFLNGTDTLLAVREDLARALAARRVRAAFVSSRHKQAFEETYLETSGAGRVARMRGRHQHQRQGADPASRLRKAGYGGSSRLRARPGARLPREVRTALAPASRHEVLSRASSKYSLRPTALGGTGTQRPLRMPGAGVDDRRRLPVRNQHDKQVRDHGGLPVGIERRDLLPL